MVLAPKAFQAREVAELPHDQVRVALQEGHEDPWAQLEERLLATHYMLCLVVLRVLSMVVTHEGGCSDRKVY